MCAVVGNGSRVVVTHQIFFYRSGTNENLSVLTGTNVVQTIGTFEFLKSVVGRAAVSPAFHILIANNFVPEVVQTKISRY